MYLLWKFSSFYHNLKKCVFFIELLFIANFFTGISQKYSLNIVMIFINDLWHRVKS